MKAIMIKGDYELNPRVYEPDHIQAVLADISAAFPRYFEQMERTPGHPPAQFAHGNAEYHKERKKYREFLDADALEEYEYDPSAFKGAIQKDCPIVRRCLNSPAKVMDAYRSAFYSTSGDKMLSATANIVTFAHEYLRDFDDDAHVRAQGPEDLSLAPVDGEEYTCFGVIGGGIRSHFLYQLRARAFPNRSQAAIWALYFMTDRKDYGFADGSEFLMIQDDGAQQNYFYPYDLFAYYALQIFLMIENTLSADGHVPGAAFRYVYVDTFVRHVSELDFVRLSRPTKGIDKAGDKRSR